jgi:hypothetical protein
MTKTQILFISFVKVIKMKVEFSMILSQNHDNNNFISTYDCVKQLKLNYKKKKFTIHKYFKKNMFFLMQF